MEYITSLLETLYMVSISSIIAYILGFPIGVLSVLTEKGGLLENKYIYKVINLIINIGRSIPFILLIIILLPLTNLIVGKTFGPTATIVSLSIAATFFVGRVVEQSLKEVDKGIIESSVCMGASIKKIVTHVYLGESLPSLIRGFSLTIINLIGYSAMAGAIGGGGLGDLAITEGFYNYKIEVAVIAVIIIIVLVQIIQMIFDKLAKKVDRR